MAPLRMAQKTVRTSPPVLQLPPAHSCRKSRATSEAPYHIPRPYEQKMMNIITARALANLSRSKRKDQLEGRDLKNTAKRRDG